MKRAILIIMLVIIAFVAVLIIWRVGSYTPEAKVVEKDAEPREVTEPNKAGEVQKPGDVNAPAVDVNAPADVNEPNEPADPNSRCTAIWSSERTGISTG